MIVYKSQGGRKDHAKTVQMRTGGGDLYNTCFEGKSFMDRQSFNEMGLT